LGSHVLALVIELDRVEDEAREGLQRNLFDLALEVENDLEVHIEVGAKILKTKAIKFFKMTKRN